MNKILQSIKEIYLIKKIPNIDELFIYSIECHFFSKSLSFP
jgi:hypothetical protein